MDDQEKYTRYINEWIKEGKNEEEIIRGIARIYASQEMIAKAWNINLRRVKYLFKKYGIKRYNRYSEYRSTQRCTCCVDDVHVSCFEIDLENEKERYKRVCCFCQRDYYKNQYSKRVIALQWEQERLKREIFTKEYELSVLKDMLK